MSNTVEIVIRGSNATGGAFTAVRNGLQGLRSQLDSAGASLRATGALLTAGVTLPLTMLGKAALDVAMDYEASMNMLQAVTGATADEMAEAGRVAKQLGADMFLPATSAADAGEAMTELAKAGLSVTDTLNAARGVLQLSAAGQLSNAEAARIAANALNAFGLEGDQATMVANLLAAAANSSSGEVKDMADSLQMASAVFAAAGVPIQDLTAAIGEMANKGIIGSDAGTSLKQMLLSLQAPSKKAAGLMEDLGIAVYDAQGKMLPMRDIIGQFSTKLAGLTQQQRDAALAVIFGSDAVRAANIVLMGGVGAFDAMREAVTKEGAAADLAAARMAGLRGALEGLKSQAETLMLVALEPMLPLLEGIVRSVAEFIGNLSALNPELLKWGLIVVGLVAALGPFLLILGAIAAGLSAILTPIGLILAGLALMAAAYATNFLGIRDTVNGFVAFVSPLIQQVIGWFQTAIPAALNFLGALWAEYWPRVQSVFETVWNAIRTVALAVIDAVVPFIISQFQIVVDWVAANWPLIQQTIDTVLNAIVTGVEWALTRIRTFWDTNGAAIIAIVDAAWTIIKTVIELALRNILDVIKAIMQAINGDWAGAWETLKGVAIRTWEALRAVADAAMQALRAVFSAALAAIQTNWYNAWNWIKGKGDEFLSSIRNNITLRLTAVRAIIAATLATIQASWYSAWNWIKGKGHEFWDSIHKGITDKFTAIRDFLRETFLSILRSFISVFSQLVEKARAAGEGIMQSLKQGIGAVSIPLPRFTIEWRDGPMGIKIPSLAWDIVWRSIRDLIPQAFATGGIVTGPTLAMIGEAGPEAVVPLSGRYAQHGTGMPNGGRQGERVVQLLTQIRDLLEQAANEGGPSFGASDLSYRLAMQ